MHALQYRETITLGDFGLFVESSRRGDRLTGHDLEDRLPRLLMDEAIEFLGQHGPGLLLLLPPEYGVQPDSEDYAEPAHNMMDELGDNLWFCFEVADQLGESAQGLAEQALGAYIEEPTPSLETFAQLQAAVTTYAAKIRVLRKLGIQMPDADEALRYATLEQNPQYVFLRTCHRLTRALDRGTSDMGPPTATELEPLQDPKRALGDFLLVLAFIAKHNLGWDIEDVVRYNAHKLTFRGLHGKGVPIP